MSFLEHIENCNHHDIANFVPFKIAGRRIGWIKQQVLPYFAAFPDVVSCSVDEITVNPALDTSAVLTREMSRIAKCLAEAGFTNTLRQEQYAVGTRFGETFFELDRAVVPIFGVRAYGLHLTGFVRDGDNFLIWVPRRTLDRPTYPGKLDNTVAGGQPAGLSLAENLEKECAEEAGLPSYMVGRARPTGTIGYRLEIEHGLRDDLIFSFDLELPPDFSPKNCDGEVEDFQLWPAEKVMSVVESTDRFKFNCNLVLIDFFIRHGVINSSHPDYFQLCDGLSRQ